MSILSDKRLIEWLRSGDLSPDRRCEAADALEAKDKEIELNRNCKAAVVIAKEWIAEKDIKIERLTAIETAAIELTRVHKPKGFAPAEIIQADAALREALAIDKGDV